jgi:hypothetical protein
MEIDSTDTGRVMEDAGTVTMETFDETTVLAARTRFSKLFCRYQALSSCIFHHTFGKNEFHKPVVISFDKTYRSELVD